MSEQEQSSPDDRRRWLDRELQRLQEQYQASEGNRILSEIDTFRNSYRVFVGNHAALKRYLDHMDMPEVFIRLWDERHRERLDRALWEVVRLLHNYIASVFSLVDSTRRFMRNNYADTRLFVEYEKRIKADFAEAPLHRFLQGLRNYTLHRSLPATKATFNLKRRDDGGFDYSNSFELDVDKLRQWDGWDKKVRQYLTTLGSTVKLADVIDSYAPVVVRFHQWLGGRLGEEHTETLQELLELETRMKEVEAEWSAAWDAHQEEQEQVTDEEEHRGQEELHHSEPAYADFALPTDVTVNVADGHTTMTAEIEGLDPHEDSEIRLFEAPFDGLIANIAFTPSEDVQGRYYTRQLNLGVQRKDGGRHVVALVQLGSDEIMLPGGERHNAHLLVPPVSLRVREGDYLVWSSIGSVGEGLAVPAGSVEVVFERRDIAADASPPELWRNCVPDYWIGKHVLVQYNDRDIHGPNAPKGEFSTYTWEDVGTFRDADAEVLQITVHPREHGRLPRDTAYPYERVTYLKLMEHG